MSVPVLTFFNNKSGVGKISLVYHLAWMLSDMGYRVLACDLDPQANLTAAFLDEDHLGTLWNDESDTAAKTILQCVRPPPSNVAQCIEGHARPTVSDNEAWRACAR